jgi:hypothetical protein
LVARIGLTVTEITEITGDYGDSALIETKVTGTVTVH